MACDGDGTRVAAAAAWRRLAGCRPTPPASSRRDLCAVGSLGARSLRRPGGGHCGDDSLALSVGAVASEVTAWRMRAVDSGCGGGCVASAGWMSADAARGLEAQSLRARLAWLAPIARARRRSLRRRLARARLHRRCLCAFEMRWGGGVTRDGDGTWVVAAAAWRRLAGCRPTPPRARGATVARSARLVRAR